MSRIGKKAIEIPSTISIQIEKEKVIVKGKNGNLEKSFLNLVSIKIEDNKLFVTRIDDSKKAKAYHGLSRVLIQNMIYGTDQNFSKTLVAEGIGYKFQVDKKN